MILIGAQAVDLVMILAILLVAIAVGYLSMILILAFRRPGHLTRPDWTADCPDVGVDTGYDVIVLMPCLNEEDVLGASLERLLDLPHPRLNVLVVDDGSDDSTAEAVRSFSDPRVHLLQRTLPHARKGKGQALNAGVEHILAGEVCPEADPERTIILVVDADGRLERHALKTVLPAFDDPSLGGVQIGVRINNRRASLLARMQDIEFVLYTEVFQRGRRHLGSTGLGGNGQFVRLSALMTLTPVPWTHSLSEDLDLGVRLKIAGWSLDFCHASAVHQQGLVSIRRWVRQRSRWFQGHLQSWGLVPQVLDTLAGKSRADLYFHLTSPFLLLASSLFSLAFVTWVIQILGGLVTGELNVNWTWATAYGFAFGPMLALGVIYWRAERAALASSDPANRLTGERRGLRGGGSAKAGFSLIASVLLCHLYVGYCLLWYIAGWRAVYLTLRGKTGWVKTERIKEVTPTATPDRRHHDLGVDSPVLPAR